MGSTAPWPTLSASVSLRPYEKSSRKVVMEERGQVLLWEAPMEARNWAYNLRRGSSVGGNVLGSNPLDGSGRKLLRLRKLKQPSLLIVGFREAQT